MGMKALIVDDDLDIQDLVATYMRSHGFDVTICSNANDALLVAGKSKFEIVFTDYNLGEGKMDGLTFARRLAERSAGPPRVVLMSGQGIPGLEIGRTIAAFLQKPFTYAEFRRVLSS